MRGKGGKEEGRDFVYHTDISGRTQYILCWERVSGVGGDTQFFPFVPFEFYFLCTHNLIIYGLGFSLMIEYLPSMQKALGHISSTNKKKDKAISQRKIEKVGQVWYIAIIPAAGK